MNDKTITHSSGNVFADFGIDNPSEYMAKAELAAQIARLVKARRFTQAAAGELLGIAQPKVSDLLKGRLDGFSTDRLLRFLNALGCDVEITVLPPHPQAPGHVLVSGFVTK